jgi:hypothetical protein
MYGEKVPQKKFFIVLKQRLQGQIKGNKCRIENFKAISHLKEKKEFTSCYSDFLKATSVHLPPCIVVSYFTGNPTNKNNVSELNS